MEKFQEGYNLASKMFELFGDDLTMAANSRLDLFDTESVDDLNFIKGFAARVKSQKIMRGDISARDTILIKIVPA